MDVKEFVRRHPRGAVNVKEAETIVRLALRGVSIKPLFVEVGSFQGHTAWLVADAFREEGVNANVISIDINRIPRGSIPRKDARRLRTRMKFVRGTSHDVDEMAGCVFIDGCHCLRCVRRDIRWWAPRIVPGGYILLHDIHGEGKVQRNFIHAGRPFAVRAAYVAERDRLSEFSVAGQQANLMVLCRA